MIYSYKQFQTYIHGTKFSVVTDHSSLQWLQNLKEPEGQLARWALKLQAYDFEILHRAGKVHQNADGLSRLPISCHHVKEANRLYDLISQKDQWEFKIEEIQEILECLAKNTKKIKSQLVKKLKNYNWYIFAKPSDRFYIICNAHRVTGHSAKTKTLEKIKEDNYWESLSFDIAKYINIFALCQKDKIFNAVLPLISSNLIFIFTLSVWI